jgi:hypothetical protein
MLDGVDVSTDPPLIPWGRDVVAATGDEVVAQVWTDEGQAPLTRGAHWTEPGVLDEVAQLT